MDVNPELVKKVVKETGEKSKGRAVDRAMEEFLDRRAIDRLRAARGTMPDLRSRDEWHEKDFELEMEHVKERQW
jgi:hypothetical protein